MFPQCRDVSGRAVSLVRSQRVLGKTASQAETIRSRSTLAIMDAAAIEAESASP